MAPSHDKQEVLPMVFLVHCCQFFHFGCINQTKRISASGQLAAEVPIKNILSGEHMM
jgi:hypothetical protein